MSAEESTTVSVKVVIVGDSAAQKGRTLAAYLANQSATSLDYTATVIDNYVIEHKHDNVTYEVGLWDTAGKPLSSRSNHY